MTIIFNFFYNFRSMTNKTASTSFSDEIIEAVSIDCLIFGFRNSELDILLIKHGEGISKGKWALPGGWITYNEDVDAAANRILQSLTGVSNIYLEQLKSFGNVN